MNGKLQLWGLPALILGLGLYSLVFFYQEAARLKWKADTNRSTLEVLKSVTKGKEADSLFEMALIRDTMPPVSPFGQPVPPRPKTPVTMGTAPTWVRPKIQLKGTVGSQAATLINSQGEKKILREGDYLDSALIVRIQPGRVTLRDSHGTFEITSQE